MKTTRRRDCGPKPFTELLEAKVDERGELRQSLRGNCSCGAVLGAPGTEGFDPTKPGTGFVSKMPHARGLVESWPIQLLSYSTPLLLRECIKNTRVRNDSDANESLK